MSVLTKKSRIHPLRKIKKGLEQGLAARDDEDEEDMEVKEETPAPLTLSVTTAQAASKFIAQRSALKDKVLKEVMDNAFPDMHEFDVDAFVTTKPIEEPPSKFVRFLRLIGFLDVSIHEAILNGSVLQLKRSIDVAQKKLKAALIEKSYINEVNEDGLTPLEIAVRIRRYDLAECLLVYEADPDTVNEETGLTPLLYSVTQGTTLITSLLIRYGADINLSDFNGTTALMYASSLGDMDHCLMLTRNTKCQFDYVDRNGWSALHYCAFGGSPLVCALLLENGIDRDIKDNNNRLAFHVAKFRNHGEIEYMLERKTRTLNYTTNFDKFIKQEND